LFCSVAYQDERVFDVFPNSFFNFVCRILEDIKGFLRAGREQEKEEKEEEEKREGEGRKGGEDEAGIQIERGDDREKKRP
jgi:hypothetical protein